jgi:hypothetical protein
VFTNITEEMIEAAEEDEAPSSEGLITNPPVDESQKVGDSRWSKLAKRYLGK